VDALSHPCNDEQEVGEQQLLLLPKEAFLNLAEADDLNSLEALLVVAQQQYAPWLKQRKECLGWREDQGQWRDANHRVVVPLDQALQRHIMHAYHDGLTAHPGCNETARKVLKQFCWPGGRVWIEQYVKGCTTYQQNQNLTH